MCSIASYRGGRVSMKRGAVPFVIFALFDLSVFTVFTAVYSVFDYWTENERFRGTRINKRSCCRRYSLTTRIRRKLLNMPAARFGR